MDVTTNIDKEYMNTDTVLDTQPSTQHQRPRHVLAKYSLRGKSRKLEESLSKEYPVLGPIALGGQCTAIFAQPNAGKTLMTLYFVRESLSQGRIDPRDVFYVNCDDSASGLYEKLQFAEDLGFEMLAPHHEGFSVETLKSLMAEMCETGQAKGTILILDTLKKFTDVMNKSESAAFGDLCRGFSMKGGTVIALGHVTKHRDARGDVVPTGTTDITDDFDCTWTLDAKPNGAGRSIATFKNKKRRGNVPDFAAYSYSKDGSLSYFDRLDSVLEEEVGLDEYEIETPPRKSNDEIVIPVIVELIGDGYSSKTDLKTKCAEITKVGQAKVGQIIDKYTGEDPTQHYWNFISGAHGRQNFNLIEREPAPKHYNEDDY